MKRTTLIALLSLLATVFLIGIPTAAGFYPQIVAGLAESVPLDLIFTWMLRVGILALGFTLGWYLRGNEETVEAERVRAIKGCIEKGGIAWKGTANLSGGQLVDYNLPYKPICPKCQTPLKKDRFEVPMQQRRSYPSHSRSSQTKKIWACPNDECGHGTARNGENHDEAENLFERHLGRIIETEDESYSLQNLLNRLGEDEEVTAQRIWEEYAEVVDDEQVRKSCFH